MRRQLLQDYIFNGTFNDSLAILAADPSCHAEGSCNSQLLGEGVRIPFRGFNSKGLGSGVNYATMVGADWGGLSNYSSVTGRGSLLQDFSKTLYFIGAGKVNKLGTLVQSANLTLTFASGDVNTGTGNINIASHGLTTGQATYVTTTLTMPLGLSSATAYWVIRIDANNFKLATSYFNAIAGTAITGGTTGSGTMSVRDGSDMTASSILQVASVQTAEYYYTYLDSAGLAKPDAPTVTVPTAPAAGYTGLINGAVNYKIAAIRDRQNVGVNLDDPAAPVKSIASTASAVVVPNNKTVKITFPTAVTGQTHWAVFSTKQGFGGTGAFYRVGYRTSSDEGATWYFGISETTVAGATDRTLEFDYRDGDLLPELAWNQDYAPPAGTHCVRLENIMAVLGCYDGTVGAVSLPNFYESYNPFHLLYFPEPIITVLHRQVDNYAFVLCRNSIHAIQYVGYRGGNLPSATVTTLTPEVGVSHQNNCAMGAGMVALWLEGAGIAMMNADGSVDFEFGREVHNFTKSWDSANTCVSFNPKTRSFVWANGNENVQWCMESRTWADPFYVTDAGQTGTWISGISAQGELVITLTNGGVQTAYTYDNNSTTTRMPVCAISQWSGGSDTGRGKRVFELNTSIQAGTNVESVVVGLHSNLAKTYVRGCSTTSGSRNLVAPAGAWSPADTNRWVAVFGTGIGNKTVESAEPTDDTLKIASHGLFTGQSVTLTTSGGLPSPLVVATTYYVINVSTDYIQLATTLQRAQAGTAINLTTTGTGTQTVVLNFIIADITYSSDTTVLMSDPYTKSSLLASATASGCFVLRGVYFFPVTPYAGIFQHLQAVRPAAWDMRTFAVSVYQPTDANLGCCETVEVRGTISETSAVKVN